MHCPYCHGTEHWKWNRPRWLRLPPGSMKNWRCSECGQEYIVWFDYIPIRQRTAHVVVRAWHVLLGLLLLVVLAFGLPALLRG